MIMTKNWDREFVIEFAKQVADLGGRAYYVGGYVRDMMLGKPNSRRWRKWCSRVQFKTTTSGTTP